MTARAGRSARRPLPDSSEGRNPLSGLPEAWGLAGLLAATPIIGAFTGLLVDGLTGLGPLFLLVGTAGGFFLAAAGFLRALRTWGSPRRRD